MNCDDFSQAALSGGFYAQTPQGAALRVHLRECPTCAALFDNLIALKSDLRDLALATEAAQAPERVELRLRQEFRTVHRTQKMRDRAVLGGWLLAAAALVMGFVSWITWRSHQNQMTAKSSPITPAVVPNQPTSTAAAPLSESTLLAENDSEVFALLPGAMPGSLEDSSVVRVQMQRGALGAFGLPVNEERASDLVEVDLLVGSDGQPQGYRLSSETN